jgi:uncharacterized repeat protein (TIGR02543 family)
VITFIYTPDTDISYTVKYELADGTTLYPDKVVNDQTMGSTVTEDAQSIAGYTPDAASKSLTLAASGNVITFIYTPVVYDITYNLDGGTNDPANPSTYTIEDSTINLLDPSKTGYTFDGWTPTGSIPAGSTGDKEFTANWTAIEYDITYILDGGTNDPANPSTYTVEDDTITLADPTKDGYTFLGWEPTDSIPAGSMGDKTFTATWSDAIVYDITYNLDGGTNDPANPSTYTVEDDTITLADPTKDGYTFLGWEPTDNIPAGSTGDKAFTATWSDPVEYTITYTLDGGTNDPANPSTYTVEDPTIELAAPTRSGYNFNGWTPTGSIPAGSTGDKTFTASWTSAAPTAFLVRFVDFDGTLLSAQWVPAGTGATAPADPTRAGFTFTGWDVPFGNITGPLTVTATYTPIPAPAPVPPAEAPTPEVIEEEVVPEAAPEAEVTPAPEVEVIEEEEVPEAAPGIAWALLNLILAVAGAIMAIVLIVGYFTRKKKEEEDGQRYNVKRRGAARIISLIPGIGGIIAFLLTEPWWVNNIVFTDMWTWLMIVIFAAQVVVAILSRRKKEEEEDGQTPAQA